MRASHLVFFLAAFALWLAFSGSVDPAHLIAGAAVALVGTFLFGGSFAVHPLKLLNPVRWYWFAVYIVVFLWECVKANFDVAYRVMHPDLPIHPGIVRIQTKLESDVARTFLANSVTMTPGTLSVDMIGETLYVHWINVTTQDVEAATERVAGRFERLLAKAMD